jgi:uncharacterized protein
LIWRAVTMALLVAAGGGAQAQTKQELVAKLVQLQRAGIESVGRVIAGQTSQRALQAAGQQILRLPADKREAAAQDAQAVVKQFYDDLEPMLRQRSIELAPVVLTPLYEKNFSEEELKQVIAWLESPVSKKFQQVDSETGNSLAQRVVAETRRAVEPKLQALEASLAKRLRAAPADAGGVRPASAPKK